MRKILVIISSALLSLSAFAQQQFAFYHSSYFSNDYALAAAVEKGEEVLYLPVNGVERIDQVYLRIIGRNNINDFIYALSQSRQVYIDSMGTARKTDDFNDQLRISWPTVDVCFYKDGKWHFAFAQQLRSHIMKDGGHYIFCIYGAALDCTDPSISMPYCLALQGKSDFRLLFKALEETKLDEAFGRN